MSKIKHFSLAANLLLAAVFTGCAGGTKFEVKDLNPVEKSVINEEDGTFVDHRDGKTYKYVVIDEKIDKKGKRKKQKKKQIWMAENLSYEAEGSRCYKDEPENCEKYGRLYDWSTAMGIDTSFNSQRFKGNFITDTALPVDYTVIRHSDYTKSGFDRGHLVKSEDRTQTLEDNRATFYLANVIPQTPNLNRRIWSQLENYCKQLAKDSNKILFIIAGGQYSENPKRINNKIAIPDSCWKVVLILDNGKSIADIDTNTQIIAVMMPNISEIDKTIKWQDFLTTTRKIEQSTGFNFHRYVSEKIQNIIENKKYESETSE